MPARPRFGSAGARLALGLFAAAVGCSPPPAPPSTVSEQNGRTLLVPARFGWVSSQEPSGALPSAIALGGKASGRVLLYFEFPELTEPRRLLRGELILTASGAPGHAVDVELSRSEAARGKLEAWSDQPQSAYPRLASRLVAQSFAARLDVTEILRVQTKPGQPLRLMLRAEPGSGEPVLVETGAAGGAQPRLELYWE